MCSEQQVAIAARLYEARTTLRTLVGERYDALLAPFRGRVRLAVEQSGLPALQAFLWLRREVEKRGGSIDGMELLHWLAAVVDVVEGPEKRNP